MESRGTVLTPAEAAVVTGYTAGHPGCLVREGIIPNAGWPGASGIARGELGRKGRRPAPEARGVVPRPGVQPWVQPWPAAGFLRSSTSPGGLTRKP